MGLGICEEKVLNINPNAKDYLETARDKASDGGLFLVQTCVVPLLVTAEN